MEDKKINELFEQASHSCDIQEIFDDLILPMIPPDQLKKTENKEMVHKFREKLVKYYKTAALNQLSDELYAVVERHRNENSLTNIEITGTIFFLLMGFYDGV